MTSSLNSATTRDKTIHEKNTQINISIPRLQTRGGGGVTHVKTGAGGEEGGENASTWPTHHLSSSKHSTLDCEGTLRDCDLGCEMERSVAQNAEQASKR